MPIVIVYVKRGTINNTSTNHEHERVLRAQRQIKILTFVVLVAVFCRPKTA
jgi:hypothetical protein